MAVRNRSTTNGSHMNLEQDLDDNPAQSLGELLLLEGAEHSENGNGHNSNPEVKKGCCKKASKKKLAVIAAIGLLIVVTIGVLILLWRSKGEKTDPEPQAPAESKELTQNSDAISLECLSVEEFLGRLKSAGLDVYWRANSSVCLSDICRVCKQIVYKDSQPSVKADRDPGRTERVKNNTCFRCDNNTVCIGFPDILTQHCSFHDATCWEKAKMANLNDYCNGGTATCYNKTLICHCSHGKAGSRCEKKGNTTVVHCNCYKGLKPVEKQDVNVKDCGREYYNHNLTCTLTVREEHCLCKAVEDEAKVKSLPSCEERRETKAGRQTSNVAQTVKVPNAVLIVIVFFALVMMCDDR